MPKVKEGVRTSGTLSFKRTAMSTSLTRGLASLRLATASSSLLPAVASTSRHLSSITPAATEPEAPKSSYVLKPIPRPSSFRSRFPDAPLHSHISHPDKLFEGATGEFPDVVGGNAAAEKEIVLASVTGLSKEEIRGLNRYAVVVKRVVNMTKKGKMPSFASMLVVGSPTRGLVGIGRGRGLTATSAIDNGFHRAVLSMAPVARFESRTLWGAGGQALTAKFGSSIVIMRGRPAGFGLHVPPAIHRLLTACGIRDASATIEGSRNPQEVLKAAIQILHGGANPPGFGSGTGRKGRRIDKGMGMRTRQEVEAERGRWGVEVGRKI